MIQRTAGQLAYYQFQNLARRRGLRHGITGRKAQIEAFPAGLNLSFYGSDQSDQVVAARELACAALNLRVDQLVVPQQVHGNRVVVVGAADRGRGALDRASAVPETDAIVTSDPGVALFISAADCVPLLFYDPPHRAIGIAHAGWRGTAARVAQRTVRKMAEAFGTKPGDLVAGIGPSIGPCCYEIREDVVQVIGMSFGALGGLVGETRDGRLSFDLWQANLIDLVTSGVRPGNVELAGICTACHNDAFFSHRTEGGRAGRFGAFIALDEARPANNV